MAKLEWTLNVLLYIINKSFFILLSIKNEVDISMDKTFRRLYRHEITFNFAKTVIFHKSKKYQGVKQKKHDSEILKCV